MLLFFTIMIELMNAAGISHSILGYIITTLFWPILSVYEYFGVTDEYTFTYIPGIHEGIWHFVLTILTSLSWGGWIWLLSFSTPPFWIIIVSLVCIFCISVILDSVILANISEKNSKKISSKHYNRIFIILYAFWRIFLPDFFIFSSLIAFATNMDLPKEKIWKLNICIQCIRVFLFIVFWYYAMRYF